MYLWLGPTDMAAIFVIALLLFGPEQLPKVARQLGDAMRHMQNTTQSFMLEMDRAAREADIRPLAEPEPFAGPDPLADLESPAVTEPEPETLPLPLNDKPSDADVSPEVAGPQPNASGDHVS